MTTIKEMKANRFHRQVEGRELYIGFLRQVKVGIEGVEDFGYFAPTNTLRGLISGERESKLLRYASSTDDLCIMEKFAFVMDFGYVKFMARIKSRETVANDWLAEHE